MPDQPISGIIPPLVTPLTPDLAFDRSAFRKLVDHVIDGGVHGIFIQGTTGEFAGLTEKIRTEMTEWACRSVAGRVPLFVNITSTSYLQTLDLARSAESAGADYLVLAPPFYYSMKQEEIRKFFEKVADRCSMPLILYNAPQYTRNELELSTVTELAQHSGICGIKDSSGNSDYLMQLLRERQKPGFSILVGPEKSLGDWLLKGCDGGVNGGGNLFPGLYVEIFRAARAGETERVKFCQELVDRVRSRLYEIPGSPLGIVIALKYALSVKGIGSGTLALPVYDQLTKLQKKTIDVFLKKMEEKGF